MFGGRFNYESRFFADGYELSGIETVSFAYNQSSSILKPLGTKDGLTVVSGPVNQTMSMSRVLTYQDPILNYTGDGSLSGSIFYNDNSYGFESGYLTDYSLNCAVGAVPRVNANFQIATELKSGIDASLPAQSHPVIDIPTQGSISITCDNSTSNRVIGFDYGVKCNRKAYLSIGERNIKKVELIAPIEYNATVQIDVDDAFMEDANNFFDDKQNKNLSLSIGGRNGNNIQTVTIPNASLVSENLQASAEGSLRLTLNYIGHVGASEAQAINSSLTYVFDENNNDLKTEAGDIPASWMAGSGNIYGLLMGSQVQQIGDGAFSGCNNLNTDLFIKSGVDVIGARSFMDCSGFKSNLLFERSDTLSIGDKAFENSSFVGDLILPNFVTDVGNGAFRNCRGFDGILRLPSGITAIEYQTFIDCSNLVGDMIIPDSVEFIKNGSFARCSNLDGNITLGTGLKQIWENAFLDCSKLKGTLNIPDRTAYIGGSSFRRCRELQEVNFGTGLNYVYDSAFRQCTNLSNVLAFKQNFTGGIGPDAFRDCQNIKGLTFESNALSYISQRAFLGCDNLQGDLDLPMKRYPGGSAANIYSEAFRGLKSLNGTLKLGEVESVANNAFRDCENIIGDLTIPSVCTNIGYDSFNNAGFDGSLYFEDYQTSYITPLIIQYSAFKNCDFKGDLVISGNERIEEISAISFQNCKFSNQLILPKNIEFIGNSAFRDCDQFTGRLIVPSGIRTKGLQGQCFRRCKNISGVYIDSPYTVIPNNNWNHFDSLGTDIGQNYLYVTARYYDGWKNNRAQSNNNPVPDGGRSRGAFLRRGSVETRVYRESDSGIEASTPNLFVPDNFYKNQASPNVFLEIGQDVTGIGQDAFRDSLGIVGSLYIPENVTNIGHTAFGSANFNGALTFSDQFFESKLDRIEPFAFLNAGFTGDLILPDSLSYIGKAAFEDCDFNGSLKYPKNPDLFVDERAFQNCPFTGEIKIPEESLDTNIRQYTFKNCTGISSLVISDSIKNFGAQSFYGCTGLKGGDGFLNDLDLQKNVKNIYSKAFYGCTNLGGVKFGGKLRIVNNEAFSGCYNMRGGFELNSNITNIGQAAFKDCSGLSYITTRVPVVNVGFDAFRIQSQPTSSKILYVDPNKLQDYIDEGEFQPGGLGYYDGNLIRRLRDNLNQTEYYNANYSPIDSGVFTDGIIPDNWQSGSGGHYLEIGNNINTIGIAAFKDNSNLSGTVVFPGVQEIKASAFENNLNVQGYVFLDGLKSIGTSSFINNSKIKELTFPDSTEVIYNYAFHGCSALESVNFKATKQIGEEWSLFKNCDKLREVIVGYNRIPRDQFIERGAFRYCGKDVTDGYVKIENSVDNVATSAFSAQTESPSQVGYPWIKTLELACREIDEYAFYKQKNITSLNLRGSLKRIRDYAFADCSGITTVSQPFINYVHAHAFSGCANIDTVKLGKINGDFLVNTKIRSNAMRRIGTNSTNGYLEVGSRLDFINSNAFYGDGGYRWIKTAKIQARNILESAFRNQTNLDTLYLDGNVRFIDVMAFENCDVTGDLDLSYNGDLTVNSGAFKNCPLNHVFLNCPPTNIDITGFSDSMVGNFYVNNAVAKGWDLTPGAGPNGKDVYNWDNYPSLTPN